MPICNFRNASERVMCPVRVRMRQAALTNPFELMLDAAPIPSGTSPSLRSTPVCSSCNSDDVICHAMIQWSNESQEWQLAGTYGRPAYCNSCNSDCFLRWQNC
jgi:hypothetical protein